MHASQRLTPPSNISRMASCASRLCGIIWLFSKCWCLPLPWILSSDCGNKPNTPQLGKFLILNKNDSLLLIYLYVLVCELLLFLRYYDFSWKSRWQYVSWTWGLFLHIMGAFVLLCASEKIPFLPVPCTPHAQALTPQHKSQIFQNFHLEITLYVEWRWRGKARRDVTSFGGCETSSRERRCGLSTSRMNGMEERVSRLMRN